MTEPTQAGWEEGEAEAIVEALDGPLREAAAKAWAKHPNNPERGGSRSAGVTRARRSWPFDAECPSCGHQWEHGPGHESVECVDLDRYHSCAIVTLACPACNDTFTADYP